jgi:hypothetical protein
LEAEKLTVGVMDGVPELVGETEAVGVAEGVGFAVGVKVLVGETVLVKVGVTLGVREGEAPAEKVGVGVEVDVRG